MWITLGICWTAFLIEFSWLVGETGNFFKDATEFEGLWIGASSIIELDKLISSLQCLNLRGAEVSICSTSELEDSLSHSEHCLWFFI